MDVRRRILRQNNAVKQVPDQIKSETDCKQYEDFDMIVDLFIMLSQDKSS
jgi:hypothetical protein